MLGAALNIHIASLFMTDALTGFQYSSRNTAELHRRAGIRRVAPFIPTQALRLWVGYSRRWRITADILRPSLSTKSCQLKKEPCQIHSIYSGLLPTFFIPGHGSVQDLLVLGGSDLLAHL